MDSAWLHVVKLVREPVRVNSQHLHSTFASLQFPQFDKMRVSALALLHVLRQSGAVAGKSHTVEVNALFTALPHILKNECAISRSYLRYQSASFASQANVETRSMVSWCLRSAVIIAERLCNKQHTLLELAYSARTCSTPTHGLCNMTDRLRNPSLK